MEDVPFRLRHHHFFTDNLLHNPPQSNSNVHILDDTVLAADVALASSVTTSSTHFGLSSGSADTTPLLQFYLSTSHHPPSTTTFPTTRPTPLSSSPRARLLSTSKARQIKVNHNEPLQQVLSRWSTSLHTTTSYPHPPMIQQPQLHCSTSRLRVPVVCQEFLASTEQAEARLHTTPTTSPTLHAHSPHRPPHIITPHLEQ
eukprot:97983-Amphidinium_carterae.1